MQAALPMGANKITGMADPTVATDGATKNYVDATTAAFFSTGDVKLTLKTVADTGWVMFDDGTIGSATSGASSRANLDTQALFTLLFNNVSDTYAPIFTSGGGATTRAGQTNAASAWAANCRMSLTKTLGRALGVAGSGSGLSARALGQTVGEETTQLIAANIPSITSTNAAQAISVASVQGNIPSSVTPEGHYATSGSLNSIIGPSSGTSPVVIGTITSTGSNSISVTSTGTSATGHNSMQPTSFLNAMVKL